MSKSKSKWIFLSKQGTQVYKLSWFLKSFFSYTKGIHIGNTDTISGIGL